MSAIKHIGHGIEIHKTMPETCPHKKCGLPLEDIPVCPGAPQNTVAVGCELGHRTHVWTSDDRP